MMEVLNSIFAASRATDLVFISILKSLNFNIMGIVIPGVAFNPCYLSQWAIETRFRKDPGTQRTDVGMLDAILSPANRSAASFQLTPTGEKPSSTNKVVAARYLPFICELSEQDPIDKCDLVTGATPQYKTANYTVTDTTTHRFSLSDDDFRSLCETPGQQYADWFLRNLDVFLRKVNAKTITEVGTFAGNYPGSGINSGTSPLNLPIVNGQGLPNPNALALIPTTFNKMQLGNIRPIAVGSGYMDVAMNTRAMAGMSETGVNLAYQNNISYFRDSQLDSVIADTSPSLVTWAPGAIQMITWNEFVGPYAYSTPLNREGQYPGLARLPFEKQFTTLEVYPGLSVDFAYNYDCNGNHTFALQLHHDTVTLPTDAFGDCQDFNYVLNWLQVCGDVTCDLITGIVSPEVSPA